MRDYIAQVLDPPQKKSTLSWWVDIFIATLIVLNFLIFILETVESFRLKYGKITDYFELFSLGVFTIEYVLRIYSAPSSREFKKEKNPRTKFALSFFGIIDFIAVFPGILLQIFGVYFPGNAVRILRLAKVFRLFKLSRYFAALRVMGKVLAKKKEQMIISITLLIILLLFSSIIMYFVERKANPEFFSSIPATMWWAVATLTTVGYGDVTPITTVGKVLGGLIAVLGVGLFALPAGILASGFSTELEELEVSELDPENPFESFEQQKEAYQKQNKEKSTTNTFAAQCPHCEKEIKITISK
ncbi:MAG: ion transporter [Luteibaculaceae bacterium]